MNDKKEDKGIDIKGLDGKPAWWVFLLAAFFIIGCLVFMGYFG